MSLEDYILNKYNNEPNWFETEVQEGYNLQRISKVLNNKEYLNGKHKILNKEDIMWKGKVFKTTKLILQEAKTILNFHSTYLLGKPISLNGSEDMVKEYTKIYRKGNYNRIDFKILDKVLKYGDCFEYVYLDNGIIKSKLISPEDSYPIFSEDTGEYIGFIEHWTKDSNKVSYYNIYYPDRVECWHNEGGELQKIDEKINISGLPIHYKNFNDVDENIGVSDLEDIKSILNEIEELLSKMTDSIYTLSMNPLPVATGQGVIPKNPISADTCGYVLNLENGEFYYASATMDYNSIKLLLDSLHKKLETIACIPSVAMGNSNVANVSEVSLSMLYSLSSVKAMMNEQWLRDGFIERWEIIKKLLELQGKKFNDDDYIDCEFNYSKPINNEELLNNLMKQWKMGAISLETIIEKSNLTTDVQGELERLQKEKNRCNDTVADDIKNNSEIEKVSI